MSGVGNPRQTSSRPSSVLKPDEEGVDERRVGLAAARPCSAARGRGRAAPAPGRSPPAAGASGCGKRGVKPTALERPVVGRDAAPRRSIERARIWAANVSAGRDPRPAPRRSTVRQARRGTDSCDRRWWQARVEPPQVGGCRGRGRRARRRCRRRDRVGRSGSGPAPVRARASGNGSIGSPSGPDRRPARPAARLGRRRPRQRRERRHGLHGRGARAARRGGARTRAAAARAADGVGGRLGPGDVGARRGQRQRHPLERARGRRGSGRPTKREASAPPAAGCARIDAARGRRASGVGPRRAARLGGRWRPAGGRPGAAPRRTPVGSPVAASSATRPVPGRLAASVRERCRACAGREHLQPGVGVHRATGAARAGSSRPHSRAGRGAAAVDLPQLGRLLPGRGHQRLLLLLHHAGAELGGDPAGGLEVELLEPAVAPRRVERAEARLRRAVAGRREQRVVRRRRVGRVRGRGAARRGTPRGRPARRASQSVAARPTGRSAPPSGERRAGAATGTADAARRRRRSGRSPTPSGSGRARSSMASDWKSPPGPVAKSQE